jgi:hypothetical protein
MTGMRFVPNSRGPVLCGFLILAVITTIPILAVRLPPILDYPNHLARMYILTALPRTPELARYYRVAWSPVPNLALDATVPWLARLVGLETAMRLFLGVTLLGLASGCLALHRVSFKRWSLWPLTAFLVLYNRMLLWGFLNYLAGLALMLWGFTAWVAMERRPTLQRVAVGTVFATAIYLAHFAAFGCYALAVIALSFAPAVGQSFSFVRGLRLTVPAVATLFPAAALFLLAPTSGGSTAIAYGNIFRKFDMPVSLFDNYNRIFDGATFGVLLIAVAVGLARGQIVLDRRMAWPVLAVFAAFAILPSRLFSASGIDHRLPIAIALLLIAAVDWGKIRHLRLVCAALLALFLVRTEVLAAKWVKADGEYESLRPALELIEPGDSVAVASPASSVQAGGIPLLHFPTLSIVTRNSFVPTLFADPLQQPVVLNSGFAKRVAEAEPGILWAKVASGSFTGLADYDDLIVLDPPASLDLAKLPGTILFQAPRLILLRLFKPKMDAAR